MKCIGYDFWIDQDDLSVVVTLWNDGSRTISKQHIEESGIIRDEQLSRVPLSARFLNSHRMEVDNEDNNLSE